MTWSSTAALASPPLPTQNNYHFFMFYIDTVEQLKRYSDPTA